MLSCAVTHLLRSTLHQPPFHTLLHFLYYAIIITEVGDDGMGILLHNHPREFVGWLVGESVGWLVGESFSWLVGKSVGCLVGKSVSWLVQESVGWLVQESVG
jgi:hypothetical protein